MKTEWIIVLLAIFLAEIYIGNGLGCSPSYSPVIKMCGGSYISGERLFLDTSEVPDETNNCSCQLITSSNEISVTLLVAPNFAGCNSDVEFQAQNPVVFACLFSGINLNVALKKQFSINFRRSVERASNNYCIDIKATTPGTTVSLNCPPLHGAPATTSTTTTTTSTTTSTTSTTTSTTTTTTTYTSQYAEWTTPTSRSDQTTSPDQGEVTTQSSEETSTEKGGLATGRVGYPNSVSQTAIIIIGVIVGAGLLVGILIAILAIIGKRNEPRRNNNKNRFTVPHNKNFELSSENGTSNGAHSSKSARTSEREEIYDDKLHRQGMRDFKATGSSHKVYDNKAYVMDDTNLDDSLVISERL